MESLGVQASPVTPAPQPGTIRDTEQPSRCRVLVVEDNVFVAQQCQRALTKAGYEVTGLVSTAEEAIEHALQRRPDMVLMDIYLRGPRDGIEAALEIFERSGIRSIYASAVSDAEMQARALLAQPLAWLPKPFSDRKLVATVNVALREFDGQKGPAPDSRSPVSGAQTQTASGRKPSLAVVARGLEAVCRAHGQQTPGDATKPWPPA
jgi:two-component system, response regulator PdtaR